VPAQTASPATWTRVSKLIGLSSSQAQDGRRCGSSVPAKYASMSARISASVPHRVRAPPVWLLPVGTIQY
jgi:hypothetical protein